MSTRDLHASQPDDAPEWMPIATTLEELGMTRDVLRQYPHTDLDHVGVGGETISDWRPIAGE